jgi:uncharacterized protein YegL
MEKSIKYLLAILLVLSSVLPVFDSVEASTNYVTANRTLEKSILTTNEEMEVTLNIQGTPPLNIVKPNDVVLIIDKSGSMTIDNRIHAAKDAAKGFVDLMDLTQHQVGIIDFSDSAKKFNLNTDAASTKSYINTIQAGGGTNTGGAISEAITMLSTHRTEAQPVIVLLTDGEANSYDYAKQQAQAAKDAGIVFYTIALLGANDDPAKSGPNSLLKEMATTSHHHHFVLGSAGLSEIYANIVKEIGMASAYDVEVKETVSSNFEIVPGSYDNNIPKPTVVGNVLTWNFLEMKNEPLTFKYKIRPKKDAKIGTVSATEPLSIHYKDYTGANRIYSILGSSVTLKHPAPLITSVSENKGSIDGGNKISIKGDFFRPGLTVKLNTNLATDVQVISPNEITATAPSGIQGAATIYVRNDDGQTASNPYHYFAQPVISSISPANGPFLGGNTIIIRGNYFLNGIKIKIGEQFATVDYKNPTEIRAVVPAGIQEGSVDVYLENPDATNVVAVNGYKYDPPIKDELTITNVSPNQGLTKGGELVYIDGKKFKQDLEVFFGDKKANLSTFYSDTRIRVVAPENIEGKVPITINNPDGESTVIADAYTYNKSPLMPFPQLTSVTPNEGLVTGGDLIILEGNNFTKDMKISFGASETAVDYFYSINKVRVKVPATVIPETVDVSVTLPDNQTVTLSGAYTYKELPPPPAPEVTNISPNSGKLSGGELVYIDGKNFVDGVKVYFGENEAKMSVFYGSQRIRVIAPANLNSGNVEVRIVNPDNQEFRMANAYTYLAPPPPPAPELTTVSPNTGLMSGGELVYIDGVNIDSKATLTFGSKIVPIQTYYSTSRIRVVAPKSDGLIGSIDITVTNPDGQVFTLPQSYTYKAAVPKITSITPNNGQLSGGELVYIDGENFDPGLTVTVGGKVTTDITYYSNARFRIKIPAGDTPGQVPIIVTNPDGQIATSTYTYNAPPAKTAPIMTKLSATSGSISGGNLVYIDGSGFEQGLKIDVGGIIIDPNIYYNATRIRIKMPASTIGIKNVQIINPDGQVSNILNYEYK